jgi:hypothetical protein
MISAGADVVVAANHHHEFTDRDVWPEYNPESSAAVARRWTGATLDGYVESSEPMDVRNKGWAAGLQKVRCSLP